jgi:hypothetical protein
MLLNSVGFDQCTTQQVRFFFLQKATVEKLTSTWTGLLHKSDLYGLVNWKLSQKLQNNLVWALYLAKLFLALSVTALKNCFCLAAKKKTCFGLLLHFNIFLNFEFLICFKNVFNRLKKKVFCCRQQW